jgi:predicted Zn-dependent protease
MKQNDIALSHFGDILERITAEHGSSDIDDYISTHPSTELRLQRFR